MSGRLMVFGFLVVLVALLLDVAYNKQDHGTFFVLMAIVGLAFCVFALMAKLDDD